MISNFFDKFNEKPYCTENNLLCSYEYSRADSITEDTLALIEYHVGAPIIVNVIADVAFATICFKEGSSLPVFYHIQATP